MTTDLEQRRETARRERRRRLLFTSLYITLSVVAAAVILVMGWLFLFGGPSAPSLEVRFGETFEVRLEADAPHHIAVLRIVPPPIEWLVASQPLALARWTALRTDGGEPIAGSESLWLVALERPISVTLREVLTEELSRRPDNPEAVLREAFPIVQRIS